MYRLHVGPPLIFPPSCLARINTETQREGPWGWVCGIWRKLDNVDAAMETYEEEMEKRCAAGDSYLGYLRGTSLTIMVGYAV